MSCAYVSGPVEVKINLRDGNGFVHLGYTVDGVQTEEMVYTAPIHSDQFGGTAGPEVERQHLGKSARIGLSLVYYDLSVVKKLRHTYASENWSANNAGEIVDVGGLITCSNRAFQILLLGTADTAAVAANAAAIVVTKLNYPNCWYDGPIKFPIGSKATIWDFDVKATPFTADAGAYSGGKTYLYTENDHLITDMAAYADATQAP